MINKECNFTFMVKRLKIKIYGRVQGVSFRQSARTMARYLGVKGFVKNMNDDSVYIEAEADSEALGKYVIWCRKGPDHARVERIESEEITSKNEKFFDIRY